MAKKIKGVLTGTENGPDKELGMGSGYCDFWEGNERTFGKGKSNATMIIWDQDKHEPVFTESEVRAMFREAIAKRYDYRESTDIVEAYDIELIANKYGIDLDLDGNLEPKTP